MNKIKKSKNYITIKISLQWISTNYNYKSYEDYSKIIISSLLNRPDT